MPCMRRWRQLTKPILAAGVPHALILGNHDDEANLMRAQIVELDQRLKVHSLNRGSLFSGCGVGLSSHAHRLDLVMSEMMRRLLVYVAPMDGTFYSIPSVWHGHSGPQR